MASTTNEQANSEPLVTIGLPTYNRPAGLKRCLGHILLQTYSNLEIIISDNCSTDPAVQQVIQEYAAKDNRITATRQEFNIGLEENFNFVFSRSSADYFIWMSDDDHFDDNYITECMKLLINNPDHVLCSGIAKYYSGEQFLFTEKMFLLNQQKAFSRVYKYFSRVGKNGNFYGLFRKRILTEKPIGLHVGCDWSFMAKLAILGKLAYVDSTSYHRSADGNSGTKKKMIRKFGFNKLQAIFFETYSAYLISSNIFNDSAVNHRFNFLERKAIVTIIFFQINYRLFLKFVRKKMGLPVN
ncbi:MAG: glycosyltransferase family 2 protein [Ferruginibacter sp.]